MQLVGSTSMVLLRRPWSGMLPAKQNGLTPIIFSGGPSRTTTKQNPVPDQATMDRWLQEKMKSSAGAPRPPLVHSAWGFQHLMVLLRFMVPLQSEPFCFNHNHG